MSIKRKSILLFGGSGLLGTKIIEQLSKKYKIIAPSHKQVDLMYKTQIKEIIFSTKTDFIIYAAGEANVELETKRDNERAMILNRDSIARLSKYANDLLIPVIYFSTDAVFKGDKKEAPYKETDKIDPINYYGLTKAKGEEEVLGTSSKNLVIRLITLYTHYFPKKLDVARIILEKLSQKKLCMGIIDQYYNPTFSEDVVQGLSIALEKKVSGILHFGSTDYTSNYQFAQEIAQRFGYPKKMIVSTTLKNFFMGKKTKRAHYSRLDVMRAKNLLGESVLHSNKYNLDLFHRRVSKLQKL